MSRSYLFPGLVALAALGAARQAPAVEPAGPVRHAGPAHGHPPIPGVVPPPTGCVRVEPGSSYAGWHGRPAHAAFPGRPTPSYMGSLGYHGAPDWYRPGGRRVGLFRYVFGGYSGVMVPW